MINLKTILLTVLATVFLCLGGCAPLNALSDSVSDNPLLASFAMRQAVAQYIAQGETLDEEHKRADQVIERGEKVRAMLEGDATKGALLKAINRSIDWQELTPADRILVIEIIALLEHELADVEAIDDQVRLTLADLFSTAISAARLYRGLI